LVKSLLVQALRELSELDTLGGVEEEQVHTSMNLPDRVTGKDKHQAAQEVA
jgi:hypothetical protein